MKEKKGTGTKKLLCATVIAIVVTALSFITASAEFVEDEISVFSENTQSSGDLNTESSQSELRGGDRETESSKSSSSQTNQYGNETQCGESSVEISVKGGESGKETTDNESFDGESGDEAQIPSQEELGQNVFSRLYEEVIKNSDTIFSALAFVATLAIGWFYKKGLIPLLTDALGRLKGAFDGARSEALLNAEESARRLDEIAGKVTALEAETRLATENVGRLGEDVHLACEAAGDRRRLATLLSAQIDMLYAIFVSSALPEYQKEEIGLRISKMREELKSYEENDQ